MIIYPDHIKLKVVYYGPGASGKTTSLKKLVEILKVSSSPLVELSGTGERTVFFDYIAIPRERRGKRILVSVYTVAGQAVYAQAKKLILQGLDGIVFVADSSLERMEDNELSLKELEVFCRDVGVDINYIPLVIQYNKRDLEDAVSVEELERRLNHWGVPHVESVAKDGVGVLEAFDKIVDLILERI